MFDIHARIYFLTQRASLRPLNKLPDSLLRFSVFILLTCGPINALAAWHFDPNLLNPDVSQVGDLSYLEQGGDVTPGKYLVDIFVNQNLIGKEMVKFSYRKQNHQIIPCLTSAQLTRIGVNLTAFPALAAAQNNNTCTDIEHEIKNSQTTLDIAHLKLDISLPQIALTPATRGLIPTSRWDNGITALLLNYNFSGANNRGSQGQTSNDYYLNLRSSMNAGPWRLHNYATWRYTDRAGSRWDNVSTYLERPVIALRASLVAGDSYSESNVFDSFGFRGVQLASDDNMLPDALRGFAPNVRGIAKSNATVTIRQNHNVIYQTHIAPGAFNITDLYPTTSSGDLQVTLKEADGSETHYVVPYSTVPLLQREGHSKFSFLAGRYRESNGDKRSLAVSQATWIQGLPWGATLYGGSIVAQDYTAFSFGAGKNLGTWGAASLDTTYADSQLADSSRHQGQSVRFRYAKSINRYGTNVQVLSTRYSTQGFYTLSDVASTRRIRPPYSANRDDISVNTGGYDLGLMKKQALQLTLSQNLGQTGALYAAFNRQTYWRTRPKSDLIQLGYNTALKLATVNLAYNYSKTPWSERADKIFSVSVSIPLDRLLAGGGTTHPLYLTMDSSSDAEGNRSTLVGVNGTALDNNALNYAVQEGMYNHSNGNNFTASADYTGRFGNLNGSYSTGNHAHQFSYGANGGVVVHRNGVVLSQPLGETNVLVNARGASGVNVENATGVKTDGRGYAVVPYATNYRQNRIALDTTTLSSEVEIDEPVTNVVPTKGALVMAEFAAKVGQRALITLMHKGKPIPFGSGVTVVQNGENLGIVSESGIVYLSGLKPQGTLTASWGSSPDRQCQAEYKLREDSPSLTPQRLTLECR